MTDLLRVVRRRDAGDAADYTPPINKQDGKHGRNRVAFRDLSRCINPRDMRFAAADARLDISKVGRDVVLGAKHSGFERRHERVLAHLR
jgi:hypothetical protein